MFGVVKAQKPTSACFVIFQEVQLPLTVKKLTNLKLPFSSTYRTAQSAMTSYANKDGRKIVAAIECGGTTCVTAVAYVDSLSDPFDRMEVASNIDPRVTISALRSWLRRKITVDGIAAVGVGSFGPIDPNRKSSTYGFITSTPKPGWGNTDLLGMLGLVTREGSAYNSHPDFDCACDGEFALLPFLFDTDVNAPAFAEFVHHHSKEGSQVSSSAYVTVGTGVGAGLVVNGRTISGLLHPEAGHIPVQRQPGDDYAGCCPYHRCCLEGMVCSRALAERSNLLITEESKGEVGSFDQFALASLPDNHPVWDTAAFYMGQLAASMLLITSVERIVFGGGIFNRTCLYDKVRQATKAQLNGYIQVDAVSTDEGLERTIAQSVWGSQAGLVGVLFLASEALKRSL